jgi:protein CpxP
MKRILLLTLIAATIVVAQGDKRGGGPSGGKMFGRGRMMQELKLTDDQKKDFEKLRTGLAKSMITTRSKIQLARVDLRQMYAEEAPDRTKIEDKAREIGKLETDMKLARTGFWFDVNKILTAEQKETWKKVPGMFGREGERSMWKMRGHRGHMMGGGSDDEEEMLYGEME